MPSFSVRALPGSILLRALPPAYDRLDERLLAGADYSAIGLQPDSFPARVQVRLAI